MSWKIAYSIFHPITARELADIPDASAWPNRGDFVSEESYQSTRNKIAEAFAEESPEYIIGYVTGFNAAVDQISQIREKMDNEGIAIWNHLMIILSEIARHMPDDYVGPTLQSSLPN